MFKPFILVYAFLIFTSQNSVEKKYIYDKMEGCWVNIKNKDTTCFYNEKVIIRGKHLGNTYDYKWVSDSIISIADVNFKFNKSDNAIVTLTKLDSSREQYFYKFLNGINK
jgi:hypothetical protein